MGVRILVSKSKGRRVDCFGFLNANEDVIIGTIYGDSGMKVFVCRDKCSIDRMIWKWNGYERVFDISLDDMVNAQLKKGGFQHT